MLALGWRDGMVLTDVIIIDHRALCGGKVGGGERDWVTGNLRQGRELLTPALLYSVRGWLEMCEKYDICLC